MRPAAFFLPTVLALVMLPPARGEPGPTADVGDVRELVATLRSPRTSSDRLERTVAELAAAGAAGTKALDDHVARELDRLAEAAARPDTTAIDREIETHRGTLRRLRGEEELSKEQLEQEGLPALDAVTAAWGRKENALTPWRRRLDRLREQLERLETIVAAWQNESADAPSADRLGRLAEVRTALEPDDAEAAGILAENERIAKGLPPEVVPAMRAVNTIRITCGLGPLLFDPKLCAAATMHSRDMESHGFFAHESPLSGKETPWDRAKLAGTTASGENIFMGSAVGSDAIEAWFLSPGHHKNMFGEGHVRQGLGRSGEHWTQLFGD